MSPVLSFSKAPQSVQIPGIISFFSFFFLLLHLLTLPAALITSIPDPFLNI